MHSMIKWFCVKSKTRKPVSALDGPQRTNNRHAIAIASFHYSFFRTTITAQIDAQAPQGGPLASIYSEKIPLNVLSCGGLPPIVNGAYTPAGVQLVDLDYKGSHALIIVRFLICLTKKHCPIWLTKRLSALIVAL